MDIAFDEPSGVTEDGFGFVANSDTNAGTEFVAASTGFGNDLAPGFGDDLGQEGFGSAVAPAPAPEFFDPPAAASYSPPAPIAAAPAPVSSMFTVPDAENPLTIWEAQHKTDLKEKAEREKVNNDKMRKDADAWLKQFSDERKKNHDLKHSDNKYIIACFGASLTSILFFPVAF